MSAGRQEILALCDGLRFVTLRLSTDDEVSFFKHPIVKIQPTDSLGSQNNANLHSPWHLCRIAEICAVLAIGKALNTRLEGFGGHYARV